MRVAPVVILLAKRPVVVLFDEGNDLRGCFLRSTIAFKGAYSGERCLSIGAEDAYSFAPWPEGPRAFGHTLPGWDFAIVEEPKPGEYRYLPFAWKALAENTRSLALRLDREPANTNTFPPLDLALLRDWETKMQLLAERSSALPITLVSGVPS